MGCDIHPYCEYKKDGQWVTADVWRISAEDREEYENPVPKVPRRYSAPRDRNYWWFDFLANVRGRDFDPPLVPRRGLPDDCCPEIKARNADEKGDAHSHSWITLAELDTAYEVARKVEMQSLRTYYFDVRMYLYDIRHEFGIEDTHDIRMVFWFDN